MKARLPSFLYKILRPYFIIAGTGILAFAPVSFMLRSLKNDVVALEYPINHFMSQCIRHGQIPYWFNTWGLGFPLQSNLSWGIFSTPQLFFCSVFHYDIYSLHIEFVFFVILAGCGMYYLLKKFILNDEGLAILLSCCYMLSGFTAGSGQWMLYITASAFIPLVLAALIHLLKQPSFRHALLFAVLYFMMFTSVYPALTIIFTYSLIFFIPIYIWQSGLAADKVRKLFLWLFIGGLISIILCLPCLYFTIELLNHIERGSPIAGNTYFFNSNYLHPGGLGSLLFPLSSVKMSFPNTEGTMLDTYMGLFTLLMLPVAVVQTLKEKNRLSWVLLVTAIFFLLNSFGSYFPLRHAMNILPGFSYFRNPAIFRSFFILAVILFLAMSLRNRSLANIIQGQKELGSRTLKITFLILIMICLYLFITFFKPGSDISFFHPGHAIRNLTYAQSLFISSIIQLFFLSLLAFAYFRKKVRFCGIVLAADLILNTLLCTPYYTVSDLPLKRVNNILQSSTGFPLQSGKVNQPPATYLDEKSNTWNNVNIFHKLVSSNGTYRGPLSLKNYSRFEKERSAAVQYFDHELIFIENDTGSNHTKMELLLQKPTKIIAAIDLKAPAMITALQNFYPGWKAYYNNKYIPFTITDYPGLTVSLPEGKGKIDFVYERKPVWISALLLHLLTLIVVVSNLFRKIRLKLKSFSLSSPN